MNNIKVSIVDDHALFRRGVADLIRETASFELLNEFASGHDFLETLSEQCPDILLLDIQMPQISGLEVLKQLNQANYPLKVVMLTACEDEQALLEALRYGAHGFLAKDTLPELILSHLKQVYAGHTILQERSINILAQQFRQAPPIQAATLSQPRNAELLQDITQREQETLRLIAKGLNNKLIARELGISDGTVKVYVKNLLRKLNVHSRLELSVWVHQNLNVSELHLS